MNKRTEWETLMYTWDWLRHNKIKIGESKYVTKKRRKQSRNKQESKRKKESYVVSSRDHEK